ncbi:MAG: DUF2157 domain-containing protein [Phycicoccus sp.]
MRTATPTQLRWLDAELAAWQVAGLLDPQAAGAIRAGYVAHRRMTLARVVLTLGAVFVGLGLIWLVAANLDALPPWARFAVVVALWLGFVVASEVLAVRRGRSGDVAAPVVGAVRLLAAGAFGAVVFQAAQSLQVPAYESALVGLWGAGALLWAYATCSLASLVLGVALVAGWFVWAVVESSENVFAGALAVAAAGLVAAAAGVLHGSELLRSRGRVEFGVPWRELGAALVLVGSFVAALPFGDDDRSASPVLWAGLGAAVVLGALALLGGDRHDRLEVGLAAVALALTAILGAWRYDTASGTDDLGAGEWARAVVAVGVYLAVASGYAVLGGLRDAGRLTWLATGALVLFTTTQAFAVFAPVLSGAVLFLAVGVVLIGTGVLADRGRRRLITEAREVAS